MRRIILITGGQRSGKSSYAEKLALSLSPTPVYIATSRIWDEEFRQRVIKHQERRGPEWTNIEEEKELSRHQVKDNVVLIDCVTLWCTNFFFDLDGVFGYCSGTYFIGYENKSGILPDKIIKLLFDSLQCSLYIRIQIKEKLSY